MKRILLLLLVFIVGSAGEVLAASSIYGPSGLIAMPTAESLLYKEVQISYDYLKYSSNAADQSFYKINMGSFKGWEIGVVGGSKPAEGVFVNAKYYLMSDNKRFPFSIALGFQDLASKSDTSLYLVASQKFSFGLAGHLGFRATFGTDSVASQLMGGVEYFVNGPLSLVAEATGEKRDFVVNLGVRYLVLPDVMLRFSVLNATGVGTAGSPYAFGVSYSTLL